MFSWYKILLLRHFWSGGHCGILMQLHIPLPIVSDGYSIFCCVRLLLILYLEDSYNLLNLPTFVLTYLLYGRLNHMIWL